MDPPSTTELEDLDAVMVAVYRQMRRRKEEIEEAAKEIGFSLPGKLRSLLDARGCWFTPTRKEIYMLKTYAWPDIYGTILIPTWMPVSSDANTADTSS